MGDTILLALGVGLYKEQRSITAVQNSTTDKVFGHEMVHQTFSDQSMDNNPLMYFLTSPNMDAMKQRWINELAKYDLSPKYQKGKKNTVADALNRISEEHFSDKEAEKILEAVPVIPGDDTIFTVYKEKEEDK